MCVAFCRFLHGSIQLSAVFCSHLVFLRDEFMHKQTQNSYYAQLFHNMSIAILCLQNKCSSITDCGKRQKSSEQCHFIRVSDLMCVCMCVYTLHTSSNTT